MQYSQHRESPPQGSIHPTPALSILILIYPSLSCLWYNILTYTNLTYPILPYPNIFCPIHTLSVNNIVYLSLSCPTHPYSALSFPIMVYLSLAHSFPMLFYPSLPCPLHVYPGLTTPVLPYQSLFIYPYIVPTISWLIHS